MLVNSVAPGIVDGEAARQVLALSAEGADVAARVEGRGMGDVAKIFLRMVPSNIVAAAADGQMLGLIFFGLLFGYFMTRIEGTPARILQDFWQGVFAVMMRITDWVMRFAPLGVFALVAKVVASTGFAAFMPLLSFFLTVLGALAFHFLVTLPLLLLLVGRVNPLRHYQAMAPALLTAFSTASSSATLPVTMDCVENRTGVSNRISSFVLPLGATVNMDGTALYECVAAMFIAQAYGVHLGFAAQFSVVLLALLTSIGVAGIPAASLVAISIILTAVGLPLEGIGLILAVDRVLDMCRTSVNVFSDSCGAVLIGRLEGETGILQRSPV
jgi:proton glutamate symport protein